MRNKGKVIIVARSLPLHNIGGMEVVCWDLCKELARLGLNVQVVTTQSNTQDHNIKHDNLDVIFLKNTKPGVYSSSWWREVSRYFDTLNPEEITSVISISAAAVSILKNKNHFKKTKFIMQAHGTSYGEFVSKLKTYSIKKWLASSKNILWFFKDWRYYRKFDYIISIGSAVTESLKSTPTKYIADAEKIIQIENGIDEKMFELNLFDRENMRRSLNIHENALVVMSASRLHEQKGVDNNIYAFSRVLKENADAYYLVCGDGPDKTRLSDLVNKLNIERNVIFLGSMSRDEIAKAMSAADLFIFLTKRVEGLPLNVLEAMGAGLPVVTSEHLSFIESEKLRKVGYSDMNGAAEAIMKLYQQGKPNLRMSYIPEKNKLSYAAEQYRNLIA
ncbi:glycosyltransferase family 4 protein [Pantoea cypripedii]|nr:glycosyltransferase family 4 protein [Pantoea cypripedii]